MSAEAEAALLGKCFKTSEVAFPIFAPTLDVAIASATMITNMDQWKIAATVITAPHMNSTSSEPRINAWTLNLLRSRILI